ncbi:MAG: ATP-binding cassette domain-containing protein [Thermoanaerobaculaceae bacterium]|nr:ATP-binding cassette domain-containing protein [Thermoanaerobaculaceae bacterium]MDI9620910.1 ATP-binding cassette domain-containing protein [Acidobacteriota bacterium]NLH10180.1 ATP-binding cassette domain-containing protein [Holophagae bacterium]HPW56796.1 ATP-binding cassette domain-containing protein [Thermoanaerobaculaceae bacterium]
MGLVRTLGLALSYWRPHLRLGLILLVILTIPQGFKAFFSYSQRLIVDRGLLGHDAALLWKVLAAVSGTYILAMAAVMLGDYLGTYIGAAILNGVRRQMYEHMQRLSVGYYAEMRSGDLVARFTSDLADVQKSLTSRLVDSVVAVLGLLINLPVAFLIDWRLALVMVFGTPLAGLGTRVFGRRAAAARYALKQEEARIASTVQETVRAQPVVKVFGLTGWILERFERQLGELARRFIRAEFLADVVGNASSFGVLVSQVIVLGVGAFMAFEGHLTTGALVAFLSLHATVSKETYDLTKKVIPGLISSSGGLQRIQELLAQPVDVRDAPEAVPMPRIQGPLRMENVRFGYSPEHPVLTDVELVIAPGQRVALVGPSGSGKSTVLQMLLRFYDPQAGRVLVDGQDLRRFTLASYHEQVAAVFQDTFLFAGTVRENIGLGKLGASDEEIVAAARAAEVHDVIAALPDGYETQVGELGGRLSGGQRQRLAIARAVLRDPAILLLDEATSALDPSTEAAINATLEQLSAGRMVVTVTHRLASARSADKIFVLSGGRVVECGTHEELLLRGELYRSLWEKQSGIEVSPDGLHGSIDPGRLGAIPILAGLEPASREALARRFVFERHEAGHEVVREGTAGDRFYVIARGKVEVVLGADGDERRLAVLTDGDFFGELALLADTPRVATVRTLQPSAFLTLGKQDFQDLLRHFPQVREVVDQAIRLRALKPVGVLG